jgi:hypothetical protein
MQETKGIKSVWDSEETLQEIADNKRLLKAGLRNHDPETVGIAIERLESNYGEQIAKDILFDTMTLMMSEEEWGFEMEGGESSPLI